MVGTTTRTLGAHAEQVACEFLEGKGLKTVSRNYRRRLGEIDLVMVDHDCLVFVEVRFRGVRRKASARVTVDYHKQRKLIRTAALFLAARPQYSTGPVRFDVVAIDASAHDAHAVCWIRDAFRPDDASL